jgi:hypothetical protein
MSVLKPGLERGVSAAAAESSRFYWGHNARKNSGRDCFYNGQQIGVSKDFSRVIMRAKTPGERRPGELITSTEFNSVTGANRIL